MTRVPPITPGQIDGTYLRQLVGETAAVIVELGANDGLTTIGLLKLFPRARIYAFEPDPRAYEKFKANVTDSRVTAFEMAIGAHDGEAEFNISSGLQPNMSSWEREKYPQGWDRSGSLRPPKTHKSVWPWVKFETKSAVHVKKLDSWVCENDIKQIDFIWADVQGGEGDLISGGIKALSRTRLFYTEYSNRELYAGQPNLEEIMVMLPNFSIVHRYEEDVLLKNTTI